MTAPDQVVIGAALAQRPFHGGHAWAILNWVLGFRSLGWRVLLLDRLDASMLCDEAGRPATWDTAVNVQYFVDLVREFGLEDDAALLLEGGRTVGVSRREVLERARGSAFLFNVMGYIDDEDVLASVPLRVFLDIDPGFPQMWRELGLHDAFAGHDRFVTVGLNIGKRECTIPTCGLDWITTLPPVALDYWPLIETHSRPFTTVAMWRGAYEPAEYEGERYGLRVHEFRKFASLPVDTGADFEIALDIDPSETDDLTLLARNRWKLVDPRAVAGTPQRYQRYVQESFAEISIAKEMYVKTRSGWFSDRSACYLASGKPVIAQSTGLQAALSRTRWLATFSSIDGAIAAVRELDAREPATAREARAMASTHLAHDGVVARAVEALASITSRNR